MINANRPRHSPSDISRRDVLKASGGAMLGLGISPSEPRPPRTGGDEDRRSVILLTMVGGPSPWETFDPKPDAPDRFRGPFGSISTAIPGVRVSEYLPEIARRLGWLTLIRSVHHTAEPTHDAGLRLLLTGRSEPGQPLLGSVAARALGPRGGMPPFVVLPDLVGPVEGAARAGKLIPTSDPACDPLILGDSARFRDILGRDLVTERPASGAGFGSTRFGRDCWRAGRLVEAGTRLVIVNMATGLFGQVNWDAHGRRPFRSFADYHDTLLPAFDQGFTGLVDFLRSRGLLDSTLVMATGEMGRTPWINESGGRDHWPGVWSALIAGGGTRGGQVFGASDDSGQPRDRPVALAELVATIAHRRGADRSAQVAGEWPVQPASMAELLG